MEHRRNVIVEWCRDHGVRYLNTSVEMWDPYDDAANIHPLDRTLYVRHTYPRHDRPVARQLRSIGVVEHGANPGWCHIHQQALEEIATR